METDTGVVYVSGRQPAALYRSTDHGQTFGVAPILVPVGALFTGGNIPGDLKYFTGLNIPPGVNPLHLPIMFWSVGKGLRVYVSIDNGVTWTVLIDPNVTGATTQGSYSTNKNFVSRQADGSILILSVDSTGNVLYYIPDPTASVPVLTKVTARPAGFVNPVIAIFEGDVDNWLLDSKSTNPVLWKVIPGGPNTVPTINSTSLDTADWNVTNAQGLYDGFNGVGV